MRLLLTPVANTSPVSETATPHPIVVVVIVVVVVVVVSVFSLPRMRRCGGRAT